MPPQRYRWMVNASNTPKMFYTNWHTHKPFHFWIRSCAILSCPTLLRAAARHLMVGNWCFGGARFNHWLSISLRKPFTPSGSRRGLFWIDFNSPSRNCKWMAISYHLNATSWTAIRMSLRSISVNVVSSVPVRKNKSVNILLHYLQYSICMNCQYWYGSSLITEWNTSRIWMKLGLYIMSVETFTHSQFQHYMSIFGFRVRPSQKVST